MESPSTTVNIPEGYDMNNGLPPEHHLAEFVAFPDEIFDCLPPLLATACNRFQRQQEKELFLVSALAVLSGMMPNVQGIYFGRQIMPNLYCFILGKYGTGKGSMMWARDLGEAVEAYREAQAKESFKAHHDAMAFYQRQQKLYDKGKLQTPPEMPAHPKSLKLFLPANSSKTGVIQLLKENDGRGLMFETEGDSLADMLRQKFGDFSDVLRKAFHHEPISLYRATNKEDIKVNTPALSVVLSGTDDQLRNLIPSIDNGLFSRFMFYKLEGDATFHNPWDSDNDSMASFFNALSAHYCTMYKQLDARTEPLQFMLQQHQQALLVSMFDKYKHEMRMLGDDLDGTVNRLGLITYRIAMILTIIRFPNVKDDTSIACLDMDFNNAALISDHLLHYSLYVYEQLKPKPSGMFVKKDDAKDEKIRQCCKAYSGGTSFRDIALMILGSPTASTTIFRWVKNYCKDRRA
jgi:hypothetical protein